MPNRPKSVRSLLQDKPGLRRLELAVSAQQALLTEVRRVLPRELAAHCRTARMRDDELILHADSPVWATRLRYLAPSVVDALQPRHRGLRQLRVRLLVPQAEQRDLAQKARKSAVAAAIIHDSARHTKQPELRAALIRLAQRLEQT